jgi:hypothetical protein
MKSFTEASLKDPVVAAGLAAGASLEQIIVALASERERLMLRILELENLRVDNPMARLWPAQEEGETKETVDASDCDWGPDRMAESIRKQIEGK